MCNVLFRGNFGNGPCILDSKTLDPWSSSARYRQKLFDESQQLLLTEAARVVLAAIVVWVVILKIPIIVFSFLACDQYGDTQVDSGDALDFPVSTFHSCYDGSQLACHVSVTSALYTPVNYQCCVSP